MDDTDPLEEAAATCEFERELGSLILSAFAGGATVEGTWEITDSVEAVPAWTVEIDKVVDANPEHDPEFIE